MSVLLKKNYEDKNNFKYDCVVMCRFDLGQRGKQYPQKHYATNFNFSENLDMNFVYSVYWDQLNHGFADHWFYSSSENMDIVSCLHDNLLSYYSPNSEYVQKVTKGWPDSNQHNEFSNEFYNTTKEIDLKTWPLNACIDNHKLYKWYFIDTGIYEKCKFVDITEDR
jgi:secreted Zn-dependent insulinase-like peptidase